MYILTSLPVLLQAFLASLFTYGMTALGASLIFFSKRIEGKLLTFCIGAASGIMIAASFFSLLLPALDYTTALPSFFTLSVGFLLGGLFIICSDLLLNRVLLSSRTRGILLCVAVTMHNIPEGMAVGVAIGSTLTGGGLLSAWMLALGIGIQNFPEGMCVAFPLKAQGYSTGRSFFIAQASGLVEIVSCVLGALFVTLVSGLLPWALSFSAGAMIAVVCAELIPEAYESHKNAASLGILFGFVLMMFLDLALG